MEEDEEEEEEEDDNEYLDEETVEQFEDRVLNKRAAQVLLGAGWEDEQTCGIVELTRRYGGLRDTSSSCEWFRPRLLLQFLVISGQ